MAVNQNKYQSFVESGGKNSVQKNQRKYRIAKLTELITQGYSRSKLKDYIEETWEVGGAMADEYIRMTYAVLGENSDEVIENSKNIQLERLEDLLRKALESDDKTASLKALDMINKLHGLYIEKKEVKLDSQKLRFSFGDEAEEDNEETGPEIEAEKEGGVEDGEI